MAKLPRGVITGGVPTVPSISPGIAVAGNIAASEAADQLSNTFLRIQQADDQAKFHDAITNAKLRLREYSERTSSLTVDEDTGKPAYLRASEDFDEFAGKLRSEVLKIDASNPAKQQISKALDTLFESQKIDVEATARAQYEAETIKRMEFTLDRMMDLGEFDEARQLIRESVLHTPADKELLISKVDENSTIAALNIRQETAMAGFDKALEAGKGAEYIASVQSEPVMPDREDNERLVTKMLGKMERAQRIEKILSADAVAAEEKARGHRNLNLRSDVSAGLAGKSEIRSAYDKGDITLSEAASLERQAEKAQNDILELAVARRQLAAGLPLDPSNKASKKVVEVEFQEILGKSSQGLFDPAVRSEVADMINTANVLPESLNGLFRSVMLKGDPTMQTALTDLADRLGPAANLPQSSKAYAALVNDAVRGGMDPERAVEYATDYVFNTPDSTKNALSKAYSEQAQDNATFLDKWVVSQFDEALIPLLNDIGGAPTEMQIDFNSIAEKYFQQTRDIEQARNLALKDLQRQWGRTDVNGDGEMVRFPLEQIHGEWAIDDVKTEMEKLGVTDYVVKSDEMTVRTGGQTYGLYKMVDGLPQPIFVEIDGKLQVAAYTPPPFEKTQAFKDELKDFQRATNLQQIKREQARREADRQRRIRAERPSASKDGEMPNIRFSN